MFGRKPPNKKTPGSRVLGRRGHGLLRADSHPEIRPPVSRRKLRDNTTTFIPPGYTVLSTPSWFASKKEVDVSIVVPLFRSSEVIRDQILSWDLEADGLTKEIIYVDDACPENTHQKIISIWEERKKELKRKKIGKIVVNNKNGGFAHACNTGAQNASGKYIIFLNADCRVTSNWVRPMVDLIESDSSIGIVGNMQLRDNGAIDSAGSEWSWKYKCFMHIGRNVHNGKELSGPILLANAPRDLLVPGEREMVTGACLLIPRDLFMDLGGFDTEYRIGYWEDSDLNLRVRSAGYKVYYQPESKVYHKVGHSKVGGHRFKDHNIRTFRFRWLESGRLHSLVKSGGVSQKEGLKGRIEDKIVGCVIACNEEEFLEVSVDSAAPLVDEWIIVVGGNEYAHKAGMCDDKGYPNDNTLEIARNLTDKYGGFVIEPPGRLWKDKVEMRNAYVTFLSPGNWMFMLDGDEVYSEGQLWRLTELMQSYDILIMQFWLFWNNMDTIGTGKWQRYPQERIVRWRHGFHYKGSNHLNVSSGNGSQAHTIYPCWKGDEKLFYHYSWVRPLEKIRQKLAYYKYQSGNDNDSYVDEIFLKWRENQELVRGKTHPMGGGGSAPFPGIHPPGVQKIIEEGGFNF